MDERPVGDITQIRAVDDNFPFTYYQSGQSRVSGGTKVVRV